MPACAPEHSMNVGNGLLEMATQCVVIVKYSHRLFALTFSRQKSISIVAIDCKKRRSRRPLRWIGVRVCAFWSVFDLLCVRYRQGRP